MGVKEDGAKNARTIRERMERRRRADSVRPNRGTARRGAMR